jgi:hypothetical protein
MIEGATAQVAVAPSAWTPYFSMGARTRFPHSVQEPS